MRGYRDEDPPSRRGNNAKVSLGKAEGLCVSDSGKALKVRLLDRKNKELWVPISQIHDDSEVFDANLNSTGELLVTEWYAEKERLV